MEKKHNLLSEKKPRISLSDAEIQYLVNKIISGDSEAFLILKPYVTNIILSVVWIKKYKLDPILKEDIFQECWLRFFKVIRLWDVAKGTLYNFLFSCFHKRIYDFLKEQKIHKLSYYNLESYPELPAVKRYDLPDDLVLKLTSRFRTFPEIFIINYIVSTVYFRIFNTYRSDIIKVLKDISGLKYKKVRFLVDYSLVILRKNYLIDTEGERWEEYLR